MQGYFLTAPHIIERIRDIIRSLDSKPSDIRRCAILLFSLPTSTSFADENSELVSHSLLSYFRKSLDAALLNDNEAKQTRSLILELCWEWVKLAPLRTMSLSVDLYLNLRDCCLIAFQRETSSKARSLAAGMMGRLAKSKPSGINSGSFGVPELIETLVESLSVGSISQTVRGRVLQAIGQLCFCFPESIKSPSVIHESGKSRKENKASDSESEKSDTDMDESDDLDAEEVESELLDWRSRAKSINFQVQSQSKSETACWRGGDKRVVRCLFDLFMAALTEFTKPSPEMQTLVGALKGLNSFLLVAQMDEMSKQDIQDLYAHICIRSITLPPELRRYAVPKAGLQFLSQHAAIFKDYLAKDAKNVVERLQVCCDSQNIKLRLPGLAATEATVRQIAHSLSTDVQRSRKKQDTFVQIISMAMSVLDNQDSSPRLTAMSIRVVASLAPAAKQFMSTNELKKMVLQISEFSERILRQGEQSVAISGEVYGCLSDFLSAIASLVHILPSEVIDQPLFQLLEQQTGQLISCFPDMLPSARWHATKALTRVLHAFHSHTQMLDTFLNRVVAPWIGLAISDTRLGRIPTTDISATNLESQGYGGTEGVVADHVELWRFLLLPSRELKKELGLAQTSAICDSLYDMFVKETIKLLQTLDLSISQTNSTSVAASTVSSTQQTQEAFVLVPKNPMDYKLFLNLVELSERILRFRSSLIPRWAFLLVRELVSLATRFPLASGFYKLLRLVIHSCNAHDYFSTPTASSESKEEEEEGSATSLSIDSRNSVLSILRDFLLVLCSKLSQFHDELLVASVHLLLRTPTNILPVSSLSVAMEAGLRIGLSHSPTALLAIETLEQWLGVTGASSTRDKEETYAILSKLLPLLTDYLSATTNSKQEQSVDTKTKESVKISQWRKSRLRSTTSQAVVTSRQLQYRIIQLLGSLGSRSTAAIPDPEEKLGSVLSWDPSGKLTMAIPFATAKIDVCLDTLLPRVVELAVDATDRATKVSSCELLHSLVILMIGLTAQSRGSRSSGQSSSLAPLWKKTMPVLLELAQDVEKVARQLFAPLVLQIIHWLTNDPRYESEETSSLLDAIIQVLGTAENRGQREYGARCLAEFLKWSIKQGSSRALRDSPMGIDALFNRMYTLLRHSWHNHRLGGATTLLRIAHVIGTEPVVVDRHVLCTLKHALVAMQLSQTDQDNQKTLEEHKDSNPDIDSDVGGGTDLVSLLRVVVLRLIRVIQQHATKLKTNNPERIEFPDGLQEFAHWLFSHSTATEPAFRHCSMNLFFDLIREKHILPPTEIDLLQAININEHCTQPQISELALSPNTVELLCRWYRHFSACLDAARWALTTSMLNPMQLISRTNSSLESSVVPLVEQAQNFVTSYLYVGVPANSQNASQLDAGRSTQIGFDTTVPLFLRNQHAKCKSEAVHCLLDFTATLATRLHQEGQDSILRSTGLIRTNLGTLMFGAVLHPRQFGLVHRHLHAHIRQKFLSMMGRVCTALGNAIPKLISRLGSKVLVPLLQQPHLDLRSLDVHQSNLGLAFGETVTRDDDGFPISSVDSVLELVQAYRVLQK